MKTSRGPKGLPRKTRSAAPAGTILDTFSNTIHYYYHASYHFL